MQAKESNLDAKDRKLVFLLSRNCRTRYRALAKALQLSPDSIRYRIERLEKEGVIRGYTIIPNCFAEGLMGGSLFISFRNLASEGEDKLGAFIRSEPRVVLAYKTQGDWDLVMMLEHKDVFELHRFTRRLKAVCGEEKIDQLFYQGHIEEYKFRQAPEVIMDGQPAPVVAADKADASFAKDFLDAPPVEMVERLPAKIDADDWKLLNQLSADARISLTELAARTGLSVGQVRYKIKALIAEGVLQAFWGIIELKKLGLQRFDLLLKLKNIDNKMEARMKSFFLNHPNVIRATVTFGPYDLTVNLACESLARCHEIIKEINREFAGNVADIDMLAVFEELKFQFITDRKGEEAGSAAPHLSQSLPISR